jgi:hypothetical protein
MAEFIVKTGLLCQFQTTDLTALGVERDNEKDRPFRTVRRREKNAPVRSTVPGPVYSLDASEHKSGSR